MELCKVVSVIQRTAERSLQRASILYSKLNCGEVNLTYKLRHDSSEDSLVKSLITKFQLLMSFPRYGRDFVCDVT
jgi:hypothetical protein